MQITVGAPTSSDFSKEAESGICWLVKMWDDNSQDWDYYGEAHPVRLLEIAEERTRPSTAGSQNMTSGLCLKWQTTTSKGATPNRVIRTPLFTSTSAAVFPAGPAGLSNQP